jgi:aspartyl-tRNA(Asn)/glutamyl-tRNA(Gln) amidotransferase subunit C
VRGLASRLALMSTISRDEVARVAALARIDLRPDELARLAGELDVIVESIAQVSAVATPDVPATSHPLPLSNVFRDDVPQRPLTVEEALSGAPDAQDGRFAVPQILGEE